MSIYNLKIETEKVVQVKAQLEIAARTYRDLQCAIEVLILLKQTTKKLSEQKEETFGDLTAFKSRLRAAEQQVVDGVAELSSNFKNQIDAVSEALAPKQISQSTV